MSERIYNKNQKKHAKNKRNTQLDEVVNKTKKTLQQISIRRLNDASTNHTITNLNSNEMSPKRSDYYSIDNYETIKPKNFDISLKLRRNNLQHKLTNESIIIKETNEDDDEKIFLENMYDENEKPKKIRIVTNFQKKNKNKNKIKNINKNSSHENLHKELKQEIKKKNPKKSKKRLHKNISADKIFSKKFLEEDSDKISTTTTCKKIKQKKINRLNSSTSNSSSKIDKFMETYERFKENQIKNQKKIEEMRKKKENHEKSLITKPKMDKNSKRIASNFQDDFFSRQKKMYDLKLQNTQRLKERLKKKEEEEISKSNISIKKLNKTERKSSIQKEINTSVDKLYAWETQRKEKLNSLKKKEEDKFKKENYNIPKINKYCYKITVNLKNSKHDPVRRLYDDDVQNRKAKKKILENIYGYTFKPNVDQKTKNIKKMNRKKTVESADFGGGNTSRSSIDNFTEISYKNNNEECDNFIRANILDRLFKKNNKLGKRNNSAVYIKNKNYNPHAIDEESEELENDEDENSILEENDNLYDDSSSSKEDNLDYYHGNEESIRKKKRKYRFNSME